VTDSRLVKSGDLFVALSGRLFEVTDSSHDGHDFLKEVFKNGAAGVIVSCPSDSKRMEQLLKLKFKFIIQVKDTLDAYQAIALYWREKFNIPVIAITGSNGKTTTKNMVTAVVEKNIEPCLLQEVLIIKSVFRLAYFG
jgi:UDP-N-acetylmuramoyl-tripeptide--D-alanyl-D-alanine ligase/murE/murF fusion protein